MLGSSPHPLVGWDLGQRGEAGRTFALGTTDLCQTFAPGTTDLCATTA